MEKITTELSFFIIDKLKIIPYNASGGVVMAAFLSDAEKYKLYSHNDGINITILGYNNFQLVKPAQTTWMQNYYTMHYIISGKGKINIGGSEHILSKGDVFFTLPDVELFYLPVEDDPWEYVWFSFSGPDAAKIMSNFSFDKNTFHFGDNHHEILCLLKDLFDDSLQKSGYYAVLSAFYKILNCIELKTETTQSYLAKQIIDENFSVPGFNISVLLDSIGISHPQLLRLFKETYGITLIKYLTQKRLERAQHLLTTTDLSVKSVAFSSGFYDELHFMKIFKKHVGTTAIAYRKQNRS